VIVKNQTRRHAPEQKEKQIMKNLRAKITLGLLTLVGASLWQTAALGAASNPGVVPSSATFAGKNYGEWAVAWWQWVWSIPGAVNPLNDTTGQYAASAQSGPVWFLAGTSGSDEERTVTVPSGKALFFPVVNDLWVNLPDLGDHPWSKDQESFARDFIGAAVDTATGLACEIDGVAVKSLASYRCKTPKNGAFLVDAPAGDIWGLTDFYGLPPGFYGPAVDDGVYLMLYALPVGQHTIHFKGTLFGGGFQLDVIYHLTVQ
jgi:hypothetical protein